METECYVEALVTIYRSTQCYTEYFVVYSLYETGISPKFHGGDSNHSRSSRRVKISSVISPEQAVTRPGTEPGTSQTQSREHYHYISLPNTKQEYQQLHCSHVGNTRHVD